MANRPGISWSDLSPSSQLAFGWAYAAVGADFEYRVVAKGATPEPPITGTSLLFGIVKSHEGESEPEVLLEHFGGLKEQLLAAIATFGADVHVSRPVEANTLPGRITSEFRDILVSAVELFELLDPRPRHVPLSCLFGGILQNSTCGAYRALAQVLSPARLAEVAASYPDFLAKGETRDLRTFLVERHPVRYLGLSARAISDLPADHDILGFTPIVEGLYQLLNHPNTTLPLAVAVTGPWGAGKSSVILQLGNRLEKWDPGLDRRWHNVTFEAWKFEKSERLWAALAKRIYDQPQERMLLTERLRFRMRVERARLGTLSFVLRRIVLPILGVVGVSVALVAGLLGATAPLSAGGTIAVVIASILVVWNIIGPTFKQAIDRYVQRAESARLLGYTSEADRDIQALIDALLPPDQPFLSDEVRQRLRRERSLYHGWHASRARRHEARVAHHQQKAQTPGHRQRFYRWHIRRVRAEQRRHAYHGGRSSPPPRMALAVFIDDLDRCGYAHVVEIVEAVNQIFNSAANRRCAFILGMDRDVVAASIDVAYKDVAQRLTDDDSFGGNFGLQFLTKLVQISIEIPRPDPDGVIRLLESVTKNKRPGDSRRIVPTPQAEEAAAGHDPDDRTVPGTILTEPEVSLLAGEASSDRVRIDEKLVERLEALIRSERPKNPAEVNVVAQRVLRERNLSNPEGVDPATIEEAARRVRSDLLDADSPEVAEAEFAVLPFLGKNPRQIKRFDNGFRLQLQVANSSQTPGVTFDVDQLTAFGKWVALRLRWPELAAALDEAPSLLEALEGEANSSAGGPATGDVGLSVSKGDQHQALRERYGEWFGNHEIMDVLCEGERRRRLSSLPDHALVRMA